MELLLRQEPLQEHLDRGRLHAIAGHRRSDVLHGHRLLGGDPPQLLLRSPQSQVPETEPVLEIERLRGQHAQGKEHRQEIHAAQESQGLLRHGV